MNTHWINYVEYVVVEIHEDMRKGAMATVLDLMVKKEFNYFKKDSLYFFYK